jgi:beta-glucosidase-like glycosyl hydrolase
MVMQKHLKSKTQIGSSEERKKRIAQLVIARLEGRDVQDRFPYYEDLVRKGIGGFIVFGGELKVVRSVIKKLQIMAETPLFIASDLEQGLGQQITGGTTFPPAMAIANSINTEDRNDRTLLRRGVRAIAGEARAAGINVIFSPVLDINTNLKNPIICTRSFSDDPEIVAWFGMEFIKGFQKNGLIACAKHFPGHGDTDRDSHSELPVVRANMKRLSLIELYPFTKAVKAGVKMIMVGHLKVPALDSRNAASLSSKIVTGLLREEMKFKGLVITDAMNMHAVSKDDFRSELKACASALIAGSDIILHPDRPEKVIDYLSLQWPAIERAVNRSYQRVINAKKQMIRAVPLSKSVFRIGMKSSRETAREIVQRSVRVIPDGIPQFTVTMGKGENLVILTIDDDNSKSGESFERTLLKRMPKAKTFYLDNQFRGNLTKVIRSVSDRILIVGVFSKISAWKGRSGLSRNLFTLLQRGIEASEKSVVIKFCCPYAIDGIKADITIEAYSGDEPSQMAAAEKVFGL